MNANQPLMDQLPEPELIRSIQSLRRENKVQDAPALLKQQAKDRLDFSEEAQDQLPHLEAECHHDSGDHARAVATYDRILVRRGDSVAHANRALAYSAMGDARRAIDGYGQAMRTDPADLLVLIGLGESCNRREEYALSLEPLRAAAALYPEDARTLCALGVAYHNLEDWCRAYKAITRAVELDPENRVARPGNSKFGQEFGLSEDS